MAAKRVLLTATLALALTAIAAACTSAVIGPGRSASGHALLWKHRDTSRLQNFIAPVAGRGLDYVALFNAGDSLLREAWVGMNSAGFAVMNTASYNLLPDTARVKDREGLVMSAALARCRSVADFAAMLDTMARPLGVQTNFGVIDSTGAGAIFETCDTGYVICPLQPDSLLIRSNYSLTGTCGRGLGRERYTAACHLIGHRRDIVPLTLTDTVSCSYWPRLTPPPPAGDKGQYIPRRSTSASVVTDGRTMWVRPGYPPRPGAVTYTLTLDSIPPELLPGPGWRSSAWP